MDELDVIIEKKTENYWKKRCELLERAMSEELSDDIRKRIIRTAAGYAGGKAHPKKQDSGDVHVDEISKPEVSEQYV
jgi:hypothetical protein